MANATNARGICCHFLSLLLADQVSFPGTQKYAASLGSYFSLQETAIEPHCIVMPETSQDVSTAVRVLTAANISADSDCHFSIRSGGHASFAGAANIEGGVTLDLSNLDTIFLAAAEGTQTSAPLVSVGVGAAWGAVYSFLDPLNLSVSGARAATVGIGGLLLGGGISYFGPQFGWACDTVANFEVVLANGDIVNTNDTGNADLLWALRGGTNNFGIVTRVDLTTFEQGRLWGGTVDRPYSTADEMIALLADFNDPVAFDEYASLISTFAYSGTQNISVVVNNMEYTKPVADPPVFRRITSLPTLVSTQRITNLTDLAMETAANDPDGYRQATATLTILPTVAAINATVRAWEGSLRFVRNIPGIIWAVGFDPLPPSLYTRHADDNALGLGNRDGKALLVVQLTMTWMNIADDDRIDRAARDLIGAIQSDVAALGALDPFVYINYAAAWQDPFVGYGEVNVERLRRTRQKYDPRGIFVNSVPGGFKIPK